ncbi:hypothetical protein [Candidatus Mycoplasma haematohominis]|uniref:hypothetical protein n=1 Tax=Candidatus Mycoplasma haematohominis TaxID=1494318 RepID=UPI001C0A7466|nr:hypothetical protein [Candidatus Mycoplasma haemohominis]
MTPQAAVGGGLLGAGAIGVGSAYLAGAFGGLDPSEPARVLLYKDSTLISDYETGSLIGKEYGNYLVSPIGSREEGGVTINNRDWWEWSYKRWQEDSGKRGDDFSDAFKGSDKVSKAFSNDTSKALNKVCEAVYKQEKSKITSTAKLKRDLFKYCSILGEVKTISEAGEVYNDNTKGKDGANSKKFIAVEGNDKFWKVRNDEFYAAEGDKSKSQAKTPSSKFKSDSEKNLNVKDICWEAYKSLKSDSTNYPDTEINKFCVL